MAVLSLTPVDVGAVSLALASAAGAIPLALISTAGAIPPPPVELSEDDDEELVVGSDPASSIGGLGVPAAIVSAAARPAAFATSSKVALSGNRGILADV